MSSTTPQNQTDLLILAELRSLNAQVAKSNEFLSDLHYLLNGFTSGGASFNGYLPDAFTTAYLTVLSPVLAERLKKEDLCLEEIMKGGTLLSRQLLDELSAYRSEQEGKDVLSDALELLNDPWKKDEQLGNGQPDQT